MQKVKRIVSIVGLFSLVLTMFCGWTNPVTVKAAEVQNDYLPDGWKRVDTASLSAEEIVELKSNIMNEADKNLRAPAPSLTSLQIIDLAVDEKNEIHVVTKEIGTSKNRFVYWNNNLCKENLNAMEMLVGSDRIVYGYIRYFHTGVYYSSSVSGMTARVSAKSTNAMSPWNTLSTSTSFILP